ncbi:DUF305 domain-containing protein [Amnibacterium sp.]|uniref:DUF305 domain-containing protein n=1 Tax=Amnibacterium sp. TaxID=1872496 RepID=UPI003F7C5913
MMKTRLTAALALAGSTTVLLAACSTGNASGGMDGMSGMDHSGASMSATASPSSSASSAHNSQDVSFSQGMAMHHQQAIEMSDLLLKKQGVDPRVSSLATSIKSAQQPEIDEMNGWLSSWGEQTVSGSMSGMDMGGTGNGMMSAADMAALKDASGAKASSLFLGQMIQHHNGAIEMARTEVSGGKNPAAIGLAKKIITDQAAQITQMKQLLKTV